MESEMCFNKYVAPMDFMSMLFSSSIDDATSFNSSASFFGVSAPETVDSLSLEFSTDPDASLESEFSMEESTVSLEPEPLLDKKAKGKNMNKRRRTPSPAYITPPPLKETKRGACETRAPHA
jgi:hypothetical protein